MYCIIVKNTVKEGCRDRYLEAMLPNAKASVENEPGCLVFDVLEAREEPNTFYLYEVYESTDALEVHKQTDHYKSSRPVLTDIMESTSVIRSDIIALNPEKR